MLLEINYKIALYIVIILHHFVCVSLAIFPIIAVYLGYDLLFIWLMLIVVFRTSYSRDKCILTDMENYLRVEVGWPPLKGGFVKHYYMRFL